MPSEVWDLSMLVRSHSMVNNANMLSCLSPPQSGSSVLPSLASTPRTTTPRSTSHRKPRPQTPPTSTEEVVTEIVRVFVDAIPHVPDHRRLPLLSHLLLRVGPAQFLSVALGLLLTKHVEQLGVKEQVGMAVKGLIYAVRPPKTYSFVLCFFMRFFMH